MNHKGTVPIETERLLLRPFIEADIQPAFANWTSDEAVTKFFALAHPPGRGDHRIGYPGMDSLL